MQAGVHVDRVAGHARGRATNQERYHPPDFRDVHQPMRRSPTYGIFDQFVELRDPTRCPRLQRARRHRECTDVPGASSFAI